VLGIAGPQAHLADVKRPKHPPAHLSPSPPVPEPRPIEELAPPTGEEERPDPTRYGDWERKGIAVDF
jgi:uncharacterized protein DUF1674